VVNHSSITYACLEILIFAIWLDGERTQNRLSWVMYRISTPRYDKSDQAMRWALPDRLFFACGACHILAYAFLERYDARSFQVFWQKPDAGFTGNHVFVSTDDWVFDYHGYSNREAFLAHTNRKANRWWPGWNATLVPLTCDVLVSEQNRGHTTGFGSASLISFSIMRCPAPAPTSPAFLPHHNS
jgi:hypothetical protein